MLITFFPWSVVAQRRISRSLRYTNQELIEPGFKSILLPFQSLGIVVLSTLPQFTQLYKFDEYLTIDSGESMQTNSLHAVIAAWMNGSREVELVPE